MLFWNKQIFVKQKNVNSKKIVSQRNKIKKKLVQRNKILYNRWSSALPSILDKIGFKSWEIRLICEKIT